MKTVLICSQDVDNYIGTKYAYTFQVGIKYTDDKSGIS